MTNRKWLKEALATNSKTLQVNRGVVDVSTHEKNIVEIESSGHLFDVESKHLSSLQDNTLCQKATRLYFGNALTSKEGKGSRASR
jgi:hypothetical protein